MHECVEIMQTYWVILCINLNTDGTTPKMQKSAGKYAWEALLVSLTFKLDNHTHSMIFMHLCILQFQFQMC